MMENFLHRKLPELQKSPEVFDAVEKRTRLTGEKIPNTAEAHLDAYMKRLESVFLNPDERVRGRNIEMLRPKIHEAFVINRGDVPESYFELQQRIAHERGQRVETIPENVRKQMIDVIIEDQRKSIDAWTDYLSSPDAVYPAWFKYFVFRHVTKLSQFDKERGEFKQRSKSTTATFPDIYREALAQICDIYEKASKGDPETLNNPELQDYIEKKFPIQYAEAIQRTLEHVLEDREQVKGEWVRYAQGDMVGAKNLYDSLQGKGTGWCTAGESTARAQIENGDFYVYYTHDGAGNPTQPRIAIRMQSDQIGEVRGINPHQELEPIFDDILEERLKDFGPEAEQYKKKTADMRQLTVIEKKTSKGEMLTKDELAFLYEIDSQIEGFGYERDPRIEELQRGRNPIEDVLIVFDCTSEEIAYTSEEISETTKAYIGKLEPGIFERLPQSVEYIYTSFPDEKIRQKTIELGTELKTGQAFEKEFTDRKYGLSKWAKDILNKTEFEASPEPTEADLVILSLENLGFPQGATYMDICSRADKLGLDLCPSEVGLQLRLQYPNQPKNEYLFIAMKTIVDSDGGPSLWSVNRGDSEPWLYAADGGPDFRWDSDNLFVFVRRKIEA